MRTAFAVIGSNWGDEGKGLVTDYLCAQHGADVVVRFNGGAQAGHTVVTPVGERHVFSHIGAGTFAGAATYLSRFFVCNPALFVEEYARISRFRAPRVFVDPACLVTTPYDMLINQAIETARGADRHGSCGVGFNETIERNRYREFALTVRDLVIRREQSYRTLAAIRDEWIPLRLQALGLPDNALGENIDYIAPFMPDVEFFLHHATRAEPGVIRDAHSIVFEGAQGLMLDQDNRACFPHLTRSNTGLRNVLELCADLDIDMVTARYVTRPYLTRHGAGPLEHETAEPPFQRIADPTNKLHPFQGDLRFGYLDTHELALRCFKDHGLAIGLPVEVTTSLFITCCDQIDAEYACFDQAARRTAMRTPASMADLICANSWRDDLLCSAGPTRRDVFLCDPLGMTCR